MDMVKRFDVCLVNLDPVVGSEMRKTRPVVVVSPDSMNLSRLKTIIVAPMTSTVRDNFPTRINVHFNHKDGQIALDQLRAIDRNRIIKILGRVNEEEENNLLNLLAVMFQR
jgi:mRNA interferase MazF